MSYPELWNPLSLHGYLWVSRWKGRTTASLMLIDFQHHLWTLMPYPELWNPFFLTWVPASLETEGESTVDEQSRSCRMYEWKEPNPRTVTGQTKNYASKKHYLFPRRLILLWSESVVWMQVNGICITKDEFKMFTDDWHTFMNCLLDDLHLMSMVKKLLWFINMIYKICIGWCFDLKKNETPNWKKKFFGLLKILK